jgi:hypothetical protein
MLLALVSSATSAKDRLALVPAGRIGVPWPPESNNWMSYVAFSPDGKQIASDGATTSDGFSNRLSIWSFPGGKLVRRLRESGWAISSD